MAAKVLPCLAKEELVVQDAPSYGFRLFLSENEMIDGTGSTNAVA